MKLPLRTVAGLIWVVASCTGQTAQEVTQNSSPPAVPRPIDASPAAPDPARLPSAKSAPPAEPSIPATPPNSPPAAKAYVIGPLDVLAVNVWNDAKLSHI